MNVENVTGRALVTKDASKRNVLNNKNRPGTVMNYPIKTTYTGL